VGTEPELWCAQFSACCKPIEQLKEAQGRERTLQQENTTSEIQIGQLQFEMKQLADQVLLKGCHPFARLVPKCERVAVSFLLDGVQQVRAKQVTVDELDAAGKKMKKQLETVEAELKVVCVVCRAFLLPVRCS
jgi:hypothetical protein